MRPVYRDEFDDSHLTPAQRLIRDLNIERRDEQEEMNRLADAGSNHDGDEEWRAFMRRMGRLNS